MSPYPHFFITNIPQFLINSSNIIFNFIPHIKHLHTSATLPHSKRPTLKTPETSKIILLSAPTAPSVESRVQTIGERKGWSVIPRGSRETRSYTRPIGIFWTNTPGVPGENRSPVRGQTKAGTCLGFALKLPVGPNVSGVPASPGL